MTTSVMYEFLINMTLLIVICRCSIVFNN